jgi:uncharacterized protein (UPF0332 family)
MDEVEKQHRWETAQEFYQAAATALNQQHYRACAGLAYYNCFQAMWVALATHQLVGGSMWAFHGSSVMGSGLSPL